MEIRIEHRATRRPMGVAAAIGSATVVLLAVSAMVAPTAQAAAPPTVVHVQVVTDAGTSAKNGPADEFRYVSPPIITSIKPDAGDPQGDVSIEIVGENLRDVQSVTVGGQPATNLGSVPNDGRHARAVVPAMPEGTYDVVVTTAYGTSTPDENSRYHYVPSQEWRSVDAPGTDSGNSDLYQPACSSARCYAAGAHRSTATSTDSQPLLDVQQDDGSWTQADLTPPPGWGSFDNAAIGKIACAKQGLCIATGADGQPGDASSDRKFAFVGADTDWVASQPPFPSDAPDASFTDDALACSNTKCVIAGKYQVGSKTRIVAAVWDDGTWTLHHSATLEDPKGSTRGKIFLTCPSDSVCIAAFRNGRKQLASARIALDGASKPAVTYLPWKPVADHHVLSSDGLGCISASFCVFAATEYHPSGDSDVPDGPDHGFYELYRDGKWTQHQYALPAVAPQNNVTRHWFMNSLDCAPGGYCYVVGELHARSKAAGQKSWIGPVVARISPSGVRTASPAVPDPYEGTTELRTVACTVDSSCVVSGREVIDSPTEGRNDVFDFRDRLGTKDRPMIDRIPFSDRGSELLYWGVTCASPENCISSGINRDSSNTDSAWIAETVRPGQS